MLLPWPVLVLTTQALEVFAGAPTGRLPRGSQGVCSPAVYWGVKNHIPSMFIHVLYSINSEAAGGPSSEVKLNPGVFLKIPLLAGFFWEQKQTHLTYY